MLSVRLQLISAETSDKILVELTIVSKMFNKLIRTIRTSKS